MALSTGTAVSKSSVIDMAGYEGVILVGLFTEDTSTAKSIHAEGGSSAGGGDAVDLEGTSVVATTSTGYGIAICDIYKPLEQYVVGALLTTNASTGIHSMIAIRYGARVLPTTQSTDYHYVNSEVNVSPSSGTA